MIDTMIELLPLPLQERGAGRALAHFARYPTPQQP